jgi:HD-like signal output (HDOD) protein
MALAKHWRLPPSIILAIQFHHEAIKADDITLKNTPREATIVAWANLWVNTKSIGQSGNHCSYTEELEPQFAEKIGISKLQREKIEEHFHKEFEKAGVILSGS